MAKWILLLLLQQLLKISIVCLRQDAHATRQYCFVNDALVYFIPNGQ